MADGNTSPEQAAYEANVKGWAGVDRVKADDHIIKQIESDKQNTVKPDPFESARALGVAAANSTDKQEAESTSKLAKVRESIRNMFKKPDKPQELPQAA